MEVNFAMKCLDDGLIFFWSVGFENLRFRRIHGGAMEGLNCASAPLDICVVRRLIY